MGRKKIEHRSTYRIRLKGAMSPSITEWFGDITVIAEENGETLLIGEFPDQSALRGFLDQLWNLNFTVVSVDRVE